MNTEKLNKAKEHFMILYPNGFEDEKMEEIAKKHKPQKMRRMAEEFFPREAFKRPVELMEHWVKIVSQSSMVSLFEKPKFRDLISYMTQTLFISCDF